MDEIEKQETARFLRRVHIEESRRMERITSTINVKAINKAVMRIEYMDGTADEYHLDCRDDPNNIIKFIQAVYADRVSNIQKLLRNYE